MMEFWEGMALGLVAGSSIGIVMFAIFRAGDCADCRAEIVRKLNGTD